MSSSKRVVTLVIGGPSCSGKTSLALLVNELIADCVVLHQDEYYRSDEDMPADESWGTGLKDYDHPQSFDSARLNRDIAALQRGENELEIGAKIAALWATTNNNKASTDARLEHLAKQISSAGTRLLIVEGLTVLQPEYCYGANDSVVRVGLSIDFATAKQRRAARTIPTIATASDNLNFWADPPLYFEKVAWPNSLKYGPCQDAMSLIDSRSAPLSLQESALVCLQQITALIR